MTAHPTSAAHRADRRDSGAATLASPCSPRRLLLSFCAGSMSSCVQLHYIIANPHPGVNLYYRADFLARAPLPRTAVAPARSAPGRNAGRDRNTRRTGERDVSANTAALSSAKKCTPCSRSERTDPRASATSTFRVRTASRSPAPAGGSQLNGGRVPQHLPRTWPRNPRLTSVSSTCRDERSRSLTRSSSSSRSTVRLSAGRLMTSSWAAYVDCTGPFVPGSNAGRATAEARRCALGHARGAAPRRAFPNAAAGA